MSATRQQRRLKPGEAMIGIRMPETLAGEIKAEALRRKISVGVLIEVLWSEYQKRQTRAKK
jgi:hypothetical protein